LASISKNRGWKLPISTASVSLPPPSAAEWPALDALIDERDPHCRGVVLLGQSAPIEILARGFADAAGSRHCRGFAVGRTIFHDPARAWLTGALDDAGLVAGVRRNFEALIDAWAAARPREPRR